MWPVFTFTYYSRHTNNFFFRFFRISSFRPFVLSRAAFHFFTFFLPNGGSREHFLLTPHFLFAYVHRSLLFLGAFSVRVCMCSWRERLAIAPPWSLAAADGISTIDSSGFLYREQHGIHLLILATRPIRFGPFFAISAAAATTDDHLCCWEKKNEFLPFCKSSTASSSSTSLSNVQSVFLHARDQTNDEKWEQKRWPHKRRWKW